MVHKALTKKITLKKIRSFSIFWSLFIGIGAFAGASGMISDPSGVALGLDKWLHFFQKLPFAEIFFQDLLFPGIALLTVNGITNITSFILIYKNHRYAALSAMCCGIILMLWITVQFVIFPLNFMSTLYFVFGLLQALTGYMYWKREKEEIND